MLGGGSNGNREAEEETAIPRQSRKKNKTEKVEAPPPISKKSDETISKENVKGRLSLMKQYLLEAWRGEMLVRTNLDKIRREMQGLEKKLD